MRVRHGLSGAASLGGALAILAGVGGASLSGCSFNTAPPVFAVDTATAPADTGGADVVSDAAGADAAADGVGGDDAAEADTAEAADTATALDTGGAVDTAVVTDTDTEPGGDDTTPGPDDVTLTSADDAALYDGVTEIAGDLVIDVRAAEQVTLGDLERVGGSVVVVGRADVEVTGLVSLPKLEHVGLNVQVAYVQEGAVLDLPALTFVGGHLDVSHGALSLSAPALARVNGDVRVHDVELRGLALGALATVGGSLEIGRFSVGGDLTGLDAAFPKLTRLDGDLELWAGPEVRVEAPLLVTLGGDLDVTRMALELSLPVLAHVGGDVRLENLDVAELDLGALHDVAGEIRAVGCAGPALATLDLSALVTVGGGVEIVELDDLETVALDALTTLGGRLRVARAPALAAVSAPLLAGVPTDVDVSWNGEVTLTLPSVKTIGGELDLQGNVAVVAQLGALTTVGGNVLVTDTALRGLSAGKLASIGRHLRFIGVDSEIATVAFPMLGIVVGDVEVRRLAGATSFTMNAASAVGTTTADGGTGGLTVIGNPDLAAVGFALLADVAADLVIRDNPKLPRTVIDAYVVQMTVGGTSTVCSNKGDLPCP